MSYENLFRLDKRVVVLIGGSGLIGRELARSLPEYGARVVVGARDVEKFNKFIESVEFSRGCERPVCYQVDISDEFSISGFLKKIVEEFGEIDVLINNAWPRTEDWGAGFEDVAAQSLYKNLCDHAGGFFLSCQKSVEHMNQEKGGVILNIGSIYGTVGPHFPIYDNTDMTCPAAYSLIKGGIHTFSKYLATYLAPRNIRVNCLSPGGIADSSRQDPVFVDNYKKNTPLGRMGAPDDLVGPVIFLISDASKYITGEILHVDGGWTAW